LPPRSGHLVHHHGSGYGASSLWCTHSTQYMADTGLHFPAQEFNSISLTTLQTRGGYFANNLKGKPPYSIYLKTQQNVNLFQEVAMWPGGPRGKEGLVARRPSWPGGPRGQEALVARRPSRRFHHLTISPNIGIQSSKGRNVEEKLVTRSGAMPHPSVQCSAVQCRRCTGRTVCDFH
jgi:hypothetical protein